MLSTLKNYTATGFGSMEILAQHPIPTWMIDARDLSIAYANKAACRLHGYNPEEFYELNLLDLFTEESRILFLQALANGKGGEFLQRKKDGSALILALQFSNFRQDGLDYYQLCAVDITHRANEESLLREEAKKYQAFIEQSSEGIFCQEFEVPCPANATPEELIEHSKKNSYISECNNAMARMYGFEKAEELKGMLSQHLLDYNDGANIRFLENFVRNGFRIINAESHEKDRNGNDKYFLNNAIGIVEDGRLVRVWGTQQDITEQKRTEGQLQLLANLVEQTSDILTAADLEFNPVTWNQAAERIYGVSAEQVLGRSIRDFITIHYSGIDRESVREIIRREGEWRGETFFVRPTDQKLVTLWMSFKMRRDAHGNPLGYLVSATDISERKEAECRIRESENRFRDMADSSPVMIWMCDESDTTTYINKKWLDFTGKDITGDPDGWGKLVHPDDLAKAKNRYCTAFKSQEEVTIVYRLLHKEGNYRWVQDVSVPRFSNSKFIGFIGSVVDIEDQKHKELQLAYQATILENVSDIVVTTDLEFRVKAWNKTAETYYEVMETEAIGQRMGHLVQFDFYGTTVQQAAAELKDNGFWEGEVSRVNSKGELQYFWHTVKYIYDNKSNRIGFLAVGRDITAMKLAEEKMKKSEQFYRSLISESLDGMLLVDEKADITFASLSVKNVLGYEAQDLVGRNGFEFMHPDDVPRASESLQREIEENPEVKFIIVRLLNKKGEWVWCMLRGHNMLKNPNIRSVVLYFHDDTRRKQASDALKESEKRFKQLIRDLQVGVVMQDREGRNLLCNDAFARLFGSTTEELEGKTIIDIALDPIHEDGTRFRPEERPTRKALQSKQPVKDIVMGFISPQHGERLWIIINIDPILDKDGEIVHLIASIKDITDRKKMEAEMISKQVSHQRQLTQATLDGQEVERREIGKELHDNIGQQLTTIKLFLDMARSGIEGPAEEMLTMAQKGVSDVINEVRAMSRSLVPPTLQDLGLVESVNELADSITRTQLLNIHVNHKDFNEEVLAENQTLSLFRIIQEQLNNIVKHSKAKNVWIRLANSPVEVLLEIGDDGQGFDPHSLKKGLGFINIRNRAELFGGKKEIVSRPGQGCLLKVSFPLVQQGDEFFGQA